ncbi:hypothetical protein HY837_04175 [archaeon]|nr:hypothetical protein [archaeon]
MEEIKINVAFRNMKNWKDSENRSEHVLDRIQRRGIGKEQILEAVKKGAKKIRDDKSIVSEFRWYKLVYREFRLEKEKIRKIYPITVMEA